MPFGLVSASSIFQHIIHKILRPALHKDTEVYLDNVIVTKDSFEEYLVILSETLDLFNLAGIKLPLKFSFVRKEFSCLGHVVSRNVILPNPENVNTMLDLKASKTVK